MRGLLVAVFWRRRVDGSACPLHRQGGAEEDAGPRVLLATYGKHSVSQRGEGIPNRRAGHLHDYSMLQSREGMGLLVCVPHARMGAGVVSQLRGSGTTPKPSLLESPGFSLVYGNLCDLRAFAEAKNEKEPRAGAPVSGCPWLFSPPLRSVGKFLA